MDTWQNFLQLMGAEVQPGSVEPNDPNTTTAAESTPVISISCAIQEKKTVHMRTEIW
jgi:hypothetical protein